MLRARVVLLVCANVVACGGSSDDASSQTGGTEHGGTAGGRSMASSAAGRIADDPSAPDAGSTEAGPPDAGTIPQDCVTAGSYATASTTETRYHLTELRRLGVCDQTTRRFQLSGCLPSTPATTPTP